MDEKKPIEINTEKDLIKGETIAQASEDFLAEDFKYEAFISYRHVEPDASIAEAIHKMVETFKVPKEFYVDGKRPVFRVFRDREELTTTYLSDSLQEALRSSKFLIVICSKRTPLSEWCVKEAELFKEIRGEEYIIPVLVEGEPHESFPPPILGIKRLIAQEDGTEIEEEHEILAAELRPKEVQDPKFIGYEVLEKAGDPKLEAYKKQALDLLKVEKYRIMAAILGCTYGDLKQRDKERRQKTLLKLSAVVAAALLFFGIFMVNAYRNENIARIEATQSNSAMLLNTARGMLDDGDRILAAMVSNLAMGEITQDMARFEELRAQHTGILNDTVFYSNAVAQTVVTTDNAYTGLSLHPDGKVVAAGYGMNEIGIWDAVNGARLLRFDGGSSEQYTDVEIDDTGTYLAAGGFDDTVRIWKWEALTPKFSPERLESTVIAPLKEIPVGGNVLVMRFSADGKYLYLVTDGYLVNHIQTLDVETGEPLYPPIEVKAVMSDYLENIAFDKRENRFATVHKRTRGGESLVLYDALTGERLRVFEEGVEEIDDPLTGGKTVLHRNYDYAGFTKDGDYVIASASNQYFVLDVQTGKIVKELSGGNFSSGSQRTSRFLETKDEKFAYVNSGYNIEKFDRNNWQLVSQISLGENESVKDFIVSEDGAILAISENGRVSMAKNDVMVSGSIDYGKGRASGLVFTKDGSRVLTISREDRNIKILTLADQENRTRIDGQIFLSTPDKKTTLLFSDEKIFQRDNETGNVEEISQDILHIRAPNLAKDVKTKTAFSNDKSLILIREFIDEDEDGIQEKQQLAAIDMKTGERAWQQTEDFINSVYTFTPDSAEVLQASHDGRAKRLDARTGAVLQEFDVKMGFMTGIFFSEDNSAYGITYQEGTSGLYSFPENRLLRTIPGLLVSIFRDSQGILHTISVHNNTGYHWREDASEIQQIPLAKERATQGTTDFDYNDYDRESGLLLSIMEKRNADKTSNAYLIDFASGNLIQSFVIDIKEYDYESGTGVTGIIIPGGKEILLDDNYYFTDLTPDEKNYELKKYESGASSALISVLDYETLLNRAQDVIGERKLTPHELQSIGVESKEQ